MGLCYLAQDPDLDDIGRCFVDVAQWDVYSGSRAAGGWEIAMRRQNEATLTYDASLEHIGPISFVSLNLHTSMPLFLAEEIEYRYAGWAKGAPVAAVQTRR